jgi:hypothetical protein
VHDRKDLTAGSRPQTSADSADALPWEKSRHGKPTQSYDQQWVDEFNLAIQEFAAGGYLAGSGIPVVGRTAFDHIGDIYLIPGHSDGLEQFFEKVSGGTYEWTALAVFMKTWPFSDEKDLGVRRSFAGHGVGPRKVKGTIGTISDALSQVFQRIHDQS